MESNNNNNNKKNSSSGGGGGGVSFFQMPLHYPKYTKKDYQEMPESLLDRLLAQYGLSSVVVHGGGGADLAYKRDFAMGAFLWPQSSSSQSPIFPTPTPTPTQPTPSHSPQTL